MFIANSQLIDIPLGGYSFTWSDKHASKMSKLDRFLVSQGMLDLFPNLTGLILHRHLSDHRLILLKETHRLNEWSSIKRRNKDHDRKVIQDSLIEIDLRLDKGNGLPDDLTKRANLFRDLKDIDHKDSIDLAQKAKIKWVVEGDENSKKFHSIVKKRRHLAIKGILVDGEWIENPNRVKSEFYSYYSNLFSAPAWDRSLFDVNFPRRLNSDQVFDLEDMVSNEEIKRAVLDCGSDKSPGPDGFTFEFFRKFWTIVGGDVTNAIKEFFISSSFPKGRNSSFIALIPKVMDSKHLKDFRPISLIGCQYKIIGKILVNRLSLVIGDIVSQEQSAFIKGRQILDGPLILNKVISWCKVRREQLLMFKIDFQKAFDSVRWDHLDDILGKFGFGIKWRGIYGVGVRQADVQHMAENFGYISNNLPFTYLGMKVGANMMRLNSWSDVVKKVSNKLSNWKSKPLSVGGRLTLLKFVLGAIPTYYMSLFKAPEGIISLLEKMRNKFFLGADTDDRKITWVCWNKVLAHKNKGGLGVSSLYALNLALIFKWIWRFLASSSSLWIKVIKLIHGNSGDLDYPYSSRLKNLTWIGIHKAINKLKVKGVDLMGFCKIVIGNGSTTRFWHNIWYGDICFKEKFKRLFNLELQKDVNVASKLQASNVASSFRRPPRSSIENSQFIELGQILSSISLSSVRDRWSWTLHGLGDFLVKSAREEIDKHLLIVSPSQNRWFKFLPIKLNVFSWRMMLDRLPTRWWNIHIPIFDDPSSWDSWLNDMNLSSMQRIILGAMFISMWWHI
uniref:RNA-directed DNA polymerase, eukaryota, reverse transcriptase zinc-binding domain protein n=1 Tax=Tanacetum cinerariifolium TaxID=118510 RepID=A0A699GI88_TANCI|nr:RNA-directed DNA polymerase, eukaryota, reverse transcriptase zinc-binding domain protein [Tanacetum cinerariifolium]